MFGRNQRGTRPNERLARAGRPRPPAGKAAAALAVAGLFLAGQPLGAETIKEALSRAYANNPALNAQRAGVLATQENIERSRAGYRPRISATADAALQAEQYRPSTNDKDITLSRAPRGAGLELRQNLFDGFRTDNAVAQAKSQVLASKATLHNTEQLTLLSAASAYAEVLADQLISGFIRDNITSLQNQLSQAQERHSFGDATRTELAQIETRLAGARAQGSLGESNLKTSSANYRRIIGSAPGSLIPPRPIDEAIPAGLEDAETVAVREHPAILAARHGIDIAVRQIRINQGELLPTVSVTARLARHADVNVPGDRQNLASVMGGLSVPLYEGGEVRARVRQAEHTASQRELEAASVAQDVRSAVTGAWGVFLASKERLSSAEAQVTAAETARNGIREEWRMGDRTMRELLDAEQDVLASRINLTTIQRERVLASYAVAQATGKLTLSAVGKLDLNSRDQRFLKRGRPDVVAFRPASASAVRTKAGAHCPPTCSATFDKWALRAAEH